jgi:hypothetical protein
VVELDREFTGTRVVERQIRGSHPCGSDRVCSGGNIQISS